MFEIDTFDEGCQTTNMSTNESRDHVVSSTLIFDRIDDLLIVISRSRCTSPTAFEALLDALRSPAVGRVIGFGFGEATSTSEQRKALSDALEGKRAVALTENVMLRGLLVALRWLGATISAFAPHELGKALAFLECPIEPTKVRRRARELALGVGWLDIARQLRE